MAYEELDAHTDRHVLLQRRRGQAWARPLGEQGLYDGLAAFGFDEYTGVDFPGEAAGYLPPVEAWSPSTIGNIPLVRGCRRRSCSSHGPLL